MSKYEIIDKSKKINWFEKEFASMAQDAQVVLVFTEISDL